MATQKNPGAPAQGQAAPPPTPAPAPTRKRSAMSKEKQLAISVTALLAILAAKDVSAAIKQGADVIKNAQALAKEINDRVFKKIDDRLAALNTEIAEAAKPENLTRAAVAAKGEPGKDGFVAAQPSGVDALKKLTQEMSRLQNKRKGIEAQAQAK